MYACIYMYRLLTGAAPCAIPWSGRLAPAVDDDATAAAPAPPVANGARLRVNSSIRTIYTRAHT